MVYTVPFSYSTSYSSSASLTRVTLALKKRLLPGQRAITASPSLNSGPLASASLTSLAALATFLGLGLTMGSSYLSGLPRDRDLPDLLTMMIVTRHKSPWDSEIVRKRFFRQKL